MSQHEAQSMMSHQDYNHNLLRAIDTLNQIVWHKHLLDIALEHTNEFSEKNFDRVAVLLETYAASIECETEHLQWLLDNLSKESTARF